MQKIAELNKCDLCEKSDEDLTLLSANHKEIGRIEVCTDCWRRLYEENDMVADSGSSGSCTGSPCSSCTGCHF